MAVGVSEKRVDAFEKVTGRAKYTDDMTEKNFLVAKVFRSTIANGVVKSLDISEAEKIPGVVRIITCFDVPQYKFPTAGHPWSTDPHHQDVADRLLLTSRVRYYGDDVAAVIAEDEVSANRALRAIKAEYEEYPFVLDQIEAMQDGAPQIHEEYKNNILAHTQMKKGNYDKAIEIYEKQLDDRASGEVPCYAEMAICLCKQGKSGEAEAVLQAAIDSGGNNPEWLYTLYEIQRSRGNFKGASRTLKRIRKNAGVTVFNDDYGELSVRLFLEEGRLAIAGKMAESLSSYDGEKLCAILYVLRGNYRSAMRLLRKLIDREPEELEYYSWMVLCQALWGKRSGAADYAKQGLKAFAEKHVSVEKLSRPDHLCQYGFFLYFAGSPQQAYEIFGRAAAAVPCHDEICSRCYEAYYGIGLCKAFDHDREASQEAFEKSLQIQPHNTVCRKLSENLLKSL